MIISYCPWSPQVYRAIALLFSLASDRLLLQSDRRARDRLGPILGGDATAAGRLQTLHRGRGGQEGNRQGRRGKRVPQVSLITSLADYNDIAWKRASLLIVTLMRPARPVWTS